MPLQLSLLLRLPVKLTTALSDLASIIFSFLPFFPLAFTFVVPAFSRYKDQGYYTFAPFEKPPGTGSSNLRLFIYTVY